MFGHTLNYENAFYIGGQKVVGLEDLNIAYSNSSKVLNPLGFERGIMLSNAPTEQKVSLSRHLTFSDPILGYTGGALMSGSIHYGANVYGFKSGILDEYMVNCAVGTIPKVGTNFTVYDEMVVDANASGSTATPSIYIPDQGSISIVCDNYTTNRVVGFDLTISRSNMPIYKIGDKLPSEIVSTLPLSYSATVQIDVDDAVLANAWNFLENKSDKQVSLTVKSKDKTQTILSLNLPNPSLVSESLSSNADGGVKLVLNYIGHS